MTSVSTLDAPCREKLIENYNAVRAFSDAICAPMANEDYVVQTMPDVSPTKWHLAHVSWFFETFILQTALPNYFSPDPMYAYLYNSYYNALGDRHCRPRRGQLSRPTVAETYRYRAYVDQYMREFLETATTERLATFEPLIELGLNHEQQHQELMVTDLKHVLGSNPLQPTCKWVSVPGNDHGQAVQATGTNSDEWIHFDGGIYEIGWDGNGFSFDNEGPLHRTLLEPFAIASRPVNNADWLAFIDDGGYRRSDLWLSMGWDFVQTSQLTAPLYWEREEGRWTNYTFEGKHNVDPDEPVCHISFFEADAFARWKGARLPTEAEWEVSAGNSPVQGNFADQLRFQPERLKPHAGSRIKQAFGDVWEWTATPYIGYPGYTPAAGAVGEYNGKFMCNQFVLRGGSCATHSTHIRPTYRNFFSPDSRWQFTGLRLANS
jgi:ergothioneine biosynthesis protein EgtB